MIQIIAGKKGSGKTKRLIDMTNQIAREGAHDVIFLDDDNRYMFDISHKARFINITEYHVSNSDMFLGFLYGMLSQNFDIGSIFIDAFLKVSRKDAADCEEILKAISELAEKNNVNFVLSISVDPEELPEFAKAWLI